MQGNLSDLTFAPNYTSLALSHQKGSRTKIQSKTLAKHLRKTLKIYGYILPPLTALVFSIALSFTAFYYKAESDFELLQSINEDVADALTSGHTASVVKLFHSIREQQNREILLLAGNKVLVASGPQLGRTNNAFHRPRTLRLGNSISLSKTNLVTEIPITQSNIEAAEPHSMVMLTPIWPILKPILLLALLVFSAGVAFARIYAYKLVQSVALALQPVSNLSDAIRSLPYLEKLDIVGKTGVRELDLILEAVWTAHRELENARDIQAMTEAQRLLSIAYKALIHDLHNPIATLRNYIEAFQSQEYNGPEKENISVKILQLSEQILMQIKAAKNHDQFGKPVFQKYEVTSILKEALRNAFNSSRSHQSKTLQEIYPKEPVPIVCDPDFLRRALTNLLDNALSAAKSQVNVELSKDDTTILISISDDGPGLSYEDVTLYFQGRKKSTKGERPAYGLAATQHLIQSLGGKLVYLPSEFGGANFEIRIKTGIS